MATKETKKFPILHNWVSNFPNYHKTQYDNPNFHNMEILNKIPQPHLRDGLLEKKR